MSISGATIFNPGTQVLKNVECRLKMSHDDMNDIRSVINGFGVLSGLGVDNHYSSPAKITAEGIVYTLNCDKGTHTNELTVLWPEFVYAANNRLPPGWKMDRRSGGMIPNVGCAQCGEALMIRITPDEAGRQLKAGIAAGMITQDQVRGLSQQILGGARGYAR